MNYYKFPKTIARELIKEAESLSFHKWCDELDCSVSFARKNTKKTLDEILDLSDSVPTLFTFIERDNPDGHHYEVGASTLPIGVSYFIWILVSIENGEKLIKKYNLN